VNYHSWFKEGDGIFSSVEFIRTQFIFKASVSGEKNSSLLSSDFRLHQASCDEPGRAVANAEFGMRIQRSGFRQKAAI
jgi:hypothetical protein